MERLKKQVRQDMDQIVSEWGSAGHLQAGDLAVIGCSTSEVAGEHIGTSGSEELAAIIFEALTSLQNDTGIALAFQCCEHLNRALVVEKELIEQYHLDEVAAVPVPKAGGSMASFAFQHMEQPALAESITADHGIDIGETMIGMHLRRVAVPLRFKQRSAGHARVNAARTRRKLIGGERAVYER
ncbi:TIGR01440 family protein [Lentibacillus lipolyticus]|nr:TIGR01440 family protein [Lentibacillus lipolyticus]